MMIQTNQEGGGGPIMMSTSQMGLCSTCNSIDTCTGRKTWSGPVHFCEEFDDHQPCAPKAKPAVEEDSKEAAAPPIRNGVPRKGLCLNCDLRDTCNYPAPEGGVWHCEEYR